jgi:alanine-glyoxylate transaminase/serine-glyoxylate transaminase/serine-pyruvate transaminase
VIPDRLLLGSGPSPVPRRVLDALAQPTIGHLDPAFAELMEGTKANLREVMGTANDVTMPLSGTGSAGMEAMVVNFIRPGDRVVCGVHGLFGERMADELRRNGADVVLVESQWGRALETERLIEALGDGAAAMFVVHAETSTGVRQPLDGLADACRERDALLMVDCVTSLGGVPISIDDEGVDVAFSGTQKCLNAPPGLAPFTAGPRALERLQPGQCRSWYLDLTLLLGYWSGAGGRSYHHTAPINLVYALDEALKIVLEEGMEARWARHQEAHERLRLALRALGFERLAPEGEHLASLLAVRVPEGIDEAAMRRNLLLDHGIEVSGGLGPLAGKIWRIGVMGEGARIEHQERLVTAVASLLHVPARPALDALGR